MNDPRADRIEELFERLIDEPPDRRRELLDQWCADDPAMAADVWRLVEADATDVPILSHGGARLASALIDARPTLPRPFGRYILREYLAEGGMGSIYLADRDDLGDHVAMKFLHASWTSPARRLRFAREQRTLARLTHPSIARLYDAGVTDGTPWFAMEYVEGSSLTEYCRKQDLGLRERLRLYRSICDAVSYAHRSLIVHLDLKPSNILVSDAGEVKLVDFGIARHLTETGGAAEKTMTGHRQLSMNYASPEQIRGEALDVQTDVHALGVILFELLTGTIPVDMSAASAVDLARLLQEEPPLPSTSAAQVVRASRSEWRDLDALCLAAMQREKVHRYQTVDHLLRDVDRFLADEPLEARTTRPKLYRTRKFLTRHRRAVVATAASIAALAAVSAFFTLRLVDARDRAVASEERTRRIHRLMLNLFSGDDSAAGPANGLRVVTLLDRGVREADSLDGERELQAELRHTLGGLYHKLGHLDRAEPLLSAAWKQRQAVLGPEHPQTIRAQLSVALLQLDKSETESAKVLVKSALDAAERRPEVDPLEIATAKAALGKVHLVEGDYNVAVPLLERAVEDLSRAESGVELSEALGDLANGQYYLGHIEASEATNLKSLAHDRQLFGDRHPHVAVDRFNLGNIRLDRGDYAGGEAFYREALAIDEAWYGALHPRTGADLLMLGRSLAYQSRLDEAAALYERAAAAMRESYGENHLRFASVLSLSGDLAREQGHLDRAEALFRQAATIFKAAVGEEHEFHLHQLSNLASVQNARGSFEAAEKLLRPALKGLIAAVPDQRYTAIAQTRLGVALAGQRRYAEAERHLMSGYQSLARLAGAQTAEVQLARRQLAALYAATKQPQKAEALVRNQ